MDRVRRLWWVAGLVVAGLVVVVLAPLASADPDGLEAVAERHGFLESARDAFYQLLPDYTVPGLDGNASTIAAGLIGVGLVFGAAWLLGRVIARRRGTSGPAS
jgi:hypothetical protein